MFHSKFYILYSKLQRSRAQSLLELLVSVSVGVILIGGSVSLMAVSLKSYQSIKQHLNANNLIRLASEVIQSLTQESWHNIDNLSPGIHYKPVKRGNTYVFQKGEEKNFIETGLISYWNFDEATSTIAYDNQSTNNGTLYNSPTWQSSSNCISGSCLSFNGSNSYALVSDSPDISPTNTITLEAWLKTSVAYSGLGVITKGPASGNYDYMLYFTTSGTNVSFYIKDASAVSDSITISFNTVDGQWHHYVGIFDGDWMYIYIDGVLRASKNTALTNIRDSTNPLQIGRGWGQYFNGLIDEPRIYSRALSADEIQSHYKAGLDKLDLISYWALDENGGNTVYDSQSSNNGTLTCVGTGCSNPSWQSSPNCVSGTCLSFTGTAGTAGPGSYINITNANSLTYATLEAWVYPTQVSNDQMFFTNASGNANYFRIINSKPFVSFNVSGTGQKTLAGTTTLLNNNWYHLVATYDGSVIKLFVNGIQEPNTTSQTGTLSFPSGTLNIGIWVTTDVRPFNGRLDEIRVYNRALSAEVIQQRYQSGYTRYFIINKVSRTSGNIDSVYNSGNDDPSTLKINSVVKYGQGLVSQQTRGIVNIPFFLTRSINNKVIHQSDWLAGPTVDGPIPNPDLAFATSTNIWYAYSGEIVLATTTSAGELTSSIIDTGISNGAGFNSLLWQGSLGTGGTVKFRIAFSNSSSGPWTYYGPTSTSDYYQPTGPNFSVSFPTTGSASPQNKRYIRYKSYLSTTSTSPRIDDIIINWNP